MACRRLVGVPKASFQRVYQQTQGVTFVSPPLTTRSPSHLGWALCRSASSEAAQEINAVPEVNENFYRRCRRKMGLPIYSRSVRDRQFNEYKFFYRFYRAQGVFIYEKIDALAVGELFQEFQLEDTFYSWYLLMELHLWMILSRASQHGKEGHIVKAYVVKVMWEDVRRRIKLLVTDMSVSAQTKTLDNLSFEMEFALVVYDEAVLSDDRRLAEAIWVRLYRGKEVDPIMLERVVCYVRKQIRHLDLIPREQFLLKSQFSWLPVKECRI